MTTALVLYRDGRGWSKVVFAIGALLAMVVGCREKDIGAPTTAPTGTAIGPPNPDPANAVTTPVFPDLPRSQTLVRGVDFYDMMISGSGPGLSMELLLYLPAGRHEPKSLPCVLIAPAGAASWGMAFVEGDRVEHIPYVRAGFAVVGYEVSGGLAEPKAKTHKYSELIGPAKEFMEAEGGLVNARVAIEFALRKVPEVDPSQLYACGHSSAATQALDLAANDRRIRACCAYAPCTDCVKWWGASKLNQLLPGFSEFAKRDSPLNHVDDFTCPVFLFHADDDQNVPCSLPDNQAFADAMQAAKKDITFQRVATGGHYTSMLKEGIPAGIAFLKAHGAKPLPPIIGSNATHDDMAAEPK